MIRELYQISSLNYLATTREQFIAQGIGAFGEDFSDENLALFYGNFLKNISDTSILPQILRKGDISSHYRESDLDVQAVLGTIFGTLSCQM